ncbi:hypothetical protein [Streptomyces sp. NPDC048057]|uniref:hypothetical protein n=1 Tax=Streptomyces sp. NPDC048057 TaxID=3155628 RepID=UPI0033EC659E
MSPVRTVGSLVRSTFLTPGGTARALVAASLLATLAVQHPNQAFARVKVRNKWALLPNWCFFAPNPAMHDLHLLYRTLDTDGGTSSWKSINVIAGRRLHQFFWFPGRRPEKGVFDICSELLPLLEQGVARTRGTPTYELLAAFVRRWVRDEGLGGVRGFQFALTQATGYETGHDPQIVFVSPYTELAPEPMTTSPTPAEEPTHA